MIAARCISESALRIEKHASTPRLQFRRNIRGCIKAAKNHNLGQFLEIEILGYPREC